MFSYTLWFPNVPKFFNRKQLSSYVAYSDKTINLKLVHHHEPNDSIKRKFSNRNQERDKYLSIFVPRDLYTSSCLVECIVVYSSSVLYVTFLLVLFFQCNSQELKSLEILRMCRNCSAQFIRLHKLSSHDKWSVSTCFIIYFEYGKLLHSKQRSL